MKISIHPSFDSLPPSWADLFRDGETRSFFYSREWFQNLARTILSSDENLRIYAAEQGDGLRPSAILVTRHFTSSRGVLQSRSLLGLMNYYSSLFGPLVDRSNLDWPQGLHGIAQAIRCEKPGWDVLDFRYLDVDAPEFPQLVTALRSAGLVVQTYFCFGNWYLRLDGRSYNQYFGGLDRDLQSMIKKQTRKLHKAGTVAFEIISRGDDIQRGVQTYDALYRTRWKRGEPHPDFIPGLIQACAEKGWLRLGLLHLDGQPAAAELYIVSGGIASSFKCAYDPRFSKYSPGTLVAAMMLQHAIDVDRVHEVDFLTGDDPYKRRWMSHRRERWGILAFNPRSLPGVLGIVKNLGGRAVKRSVRLLARKMSSRSGDPVAAAG